MIMIVGISVDVGMSVKAANNLPICIVDYNYHNDAIANTDQTAILAANPQILIDNDQSGLYLGGTIPSHYTVHGIEYYDYITAGYEHTEYLNTMDLLSDNISRVDAIGSDGSTGVFMDEVSDYPSVSQKSYLTSIWNECQSLGLKLIINTGVGDFDAAFLKTVSNYIMVNEAYTGSSPTSSEIVYGINRCLVANDNCPNYTNAISYTETAWNKGFGWAWCTNSTSYNLPTYMNNYIGGIQGGVVTTTTSSTTTTATTTTTIPVTTTTTRPITTTTTKPVDTMTTLPVTTTTKVVAPPVTTTEIITTPVETTTTIPITTTTDDSENGNNGGDEGVGTIGAGKTSQDKETIGQEESDTYPVFDTTPAFSLASILPLLMIAVAIYFVIQFMASTNFSLVSIVMLGVLIILVLSFVASAQGQINSL